MASQVPTIFILAEPGSQSQATELAECLAKRLPTGTAAPIVDPAAQVQMMHKIDSNSSHVGEVVVVLLATRAYMETLRVSLAREPAGVHQGGLASSAGADTVPPWVQAFESVYIHIRTASMGVEDAALLADTSAQPDIASSSCNLTVVPVPLDDYSTHPGKNWTPQLLEIAGAALFLKSFVGKAHIGEFDQGVEELIRTITKRPCPAQPQSLSRAPSYAPSVPSGAPLAASPPALIRCISSVSSTASDYQLDGQVKNNTFYRDGATNEPFIIRPRSHGSNNPNPFVLEWTRDGRVTPYRFCISKAHSVRNSYREFFVVTWFGGLVLRSPDIEDLLNMLCVRDKRRVDSQYSIRRELKDHSVSGAQLQLKSQCSYVLVPFAETVETPAETGLMIVNFPAPAAASSPLVPACMTQAMFRYTLTERRLLLEQHPFYQCVVSLQFHQFIDFIEAFAIFGPSRQSSVPASRASVPSTPSVDHDAWHSVPVSMSVRSVASPCPSTASVCSTYQPDTSLKTRHHPQPEAKVVGTEGLRDLPPQVLPSHSIPGNRWPLDGTPAVVGGTHIEHQEDVNATPVPRTTHHDYAAPLAVASGDPSDDGPSATLMHGPTGSSTLE